MDTTFIFRQRGKDTMYKTWHDFGDSVMFLYAKNATGNVVTREEIYPLQSGGLYFVGAKKSHYTAPENTAEYVRDKLFLPLSRFEKIRMLCDEHDRFKSDELIYAQIPEQERSKIEKLFSELNHYQNEAIVVSVCARLFVYLDEYATERFPVPTPSNFVFKAIKYINEHLNEPLTVDEISASVFTSKYYFCRKFKKTTGLSVMKYILLTRLSLAQELLLKEELTVSEISDRCGFSSLAYFCSVFKEKNGESPLQYRKARKQRR